MEVKNKNLGNFVEILASNDYQAIPAKLTGNNLVKAGMPITSAGAAAPTGANAVGILLYDVDPVQNPNCAIVVDGIVDWTKCKANSGATATADAMKEVLPNIIFRENIGVNE